MLYGCQSLLKKEKGNKKELQKDRKACEKERDEVLRHRLFLFMPSGERKEHALI